MILAISRLTKSEPIIYRQSDIPSISELHWFLTCHLNIENLDQLPNWDKLRKIGNEVGLLTFPVVSASEIILWNLLQKDDFRYISGTSKHDYFTLINEISNRLDLPISERLDKNVT